MATNKNQHFVPQHYLRQFKIEDTKVISCVRIEPYKFIKEAPIRKQCQADYFYANDGNLDDAFQLIESKSDTLSRVASARDFDKDELLFLRFVSVVLKLRTRRSIEEAKQLPKKVAYELVQNAVENGELPPAPDDWSMDSLDVTGVCAEKMKSSLFALYLEMATLECKLLVTNSDSAFITSDNPVVALNQLFPAKGSIRSFVGFSRSGFQLVLPISPSVALFFYDPKVYKVGNKRDRTTVLLTQQDVDVVNSLQVQSAENCLYFHTPNLASYVAQLTSKYSKLRKPVSSTIEALQHASNPDEALLVSKHPSPQLSPMWRFCKLKKNRKIGEDMRRYPLWTEHIRRATHYQMSHPNLDIFECMEIVA